MKFEKFNNRKYEEYRLIPDNPSSETPDFDMFCVYNDYECFSNELVLSLKKQISDYYVRLIAFNNINNTFSSMAMAYNEMMKCAESNRVIFLHQDIRFTGENSLNEMLEESLLVPKDSIWGVGG